MEHTATAAMILTRKPICRTLKSKHQKRMLKFSRHLLCREVEWLKKDKARIDFLENSYLGTEFWLTLAGENDVRAFIDKALARYDEVKGRQ